MPAVTVSSKGQVVIPRQIRKRLRLEEGTKIEVEVSDGLVVLRPARPKPLGWNRWEGAFAGERLLKALAEEHVAEINEDERRRS